MRFHPRHNRERQRGSAMVLFITLLAFVLIPVAGLAIDASIMYVVKSKLVTAVDSASLAAGRSLSASSCSSSDTSTQQIAAAYMEANFPANTMGASIASVTATPSCNPTTKVRTVKVQGSATVPLLFARIFGSTSTTVSASGTSSRRDVNVVLVLDRSSSMIANNVCSVMKTSAQNFVNMFTDGRDTLGLVTFMISANVDYPPSQTFKTGSPSLTSVIGKLVCNGNTGSAAALQTAYKQIQAINKPGALNVIMFFTDGLPNGVTAQFPIKSTSSCQFPPNSTLKGAIEQVAGDKDPGSTSGVNDPAGNLNIASGAQALISGPGCAFSTNTSNMRQDIPYIPHYDIWSNPTWGYKVFTSAQLTTGPNSSDPGGNQYARVDVPTAITYSSINAADAQARTIRKDTNYRTVIYVIGLGGTTSEPLDQTFLQRVANIPNGPNPSDTNDPNQAQGYYVYAPNSGQLGSAFQTIASQILHLSQ